MINFVVKRWPIIIKRWKIPLLQQRLGYMAIGIASSIGASLDMRSVASVKNQNQNQEKNPKDPKNLNDTISKRSWRAKLGLLSAKGP